MAIKSIEISQNPVTTWETFHYSFYPKHKGSSADFFDFDRARKAEEGYGRIRFKFYESRSVLESFFEFGLGRDIKVYNHKGTIDYEGFILSMRLNTGVHILKKSMQNIANKLWARYDATGGVSATQRSTVYSDTDSQTRFGTIEKVIGGGQQASATPMNQAVQNKLALISWPMIDIEYDAGKGQPYIEIIGIGYYHTLNWKTYNQTGLVGDTDLSVVVADVISNCGDFIASSSITTNTLQVPREYDVDSFAGDVLVNLAAMGDASGNRGLSRVVENRKYISGPVKSSTIVKYMINVWEPNGKITDDQGAVINPDEVNANEWIRLSGSAKPTSTVYTSNVDDPNISFIESVSYRHEQDRVTIQTSKESMLQAFLKRLGGVTS